jgi:ATP-dependent Clp protease protease subunit
MRPKLLNLLAQNKGRGFFKAETTEAGNVLYIYDVIVTSDSDAEWYGGVSSETVVKALAGMTGPITARVNSPGGDVFGGVAIANAFKAYPDSITVYVDGYAASAASTIAIAADKVIMSGDGAMFMIHKAETFAWGNADDLTKMVNILSKIDLNIANAYAAKTGKNGDEIMAMLNEGDTWFTAAEALEIGLADEMAPDKAKAPQNAKQPVWNLSAYGKPSKDDGRDHSMTLKIDASDVKTAIDEALAAFRAEFAPEVVDDAETDDERDRRLRLHALAMLEAA